MNEAIELEIGDVDVTADVDPDDVARSDDWESWIDGHDDGRYARKVFGMSDGTVVVAELLYGEERGAQLNYWVEGESSLEHIWTPATFDGEDFHRVDEAHAMDQESLVQWWDEVESVSDVQKLTQRGFL